jgi:hypothetical protein
MDGNLCNQTSVRTRPQDHLSVLLKKSMNCSDGYLEDFFSEVPRRTLEVAAAGGHNLFKLRF